MANGFTPRFTAKDAGPVVTDLFVGSAASIVPFAPIIGAGLLFKAATKKPRRKRRRK